jgi:hypothetical protein
VSRKTLDCKQCRKPFQATYWGDMPAVTKCQKCLQMLKKQKRSYSKSSLDYLSRL